MSSPSKRVLNRGEDIRKTNLFGWEICRFVKLHLQLALTLECLLLREGKTEDNIDNRNEIENHPYLDIVMATKCQKKILLLNK
jgi:hypothetical protein